MEIDEQVAYLMQGTEYGDPDIKRAMTQELRCRLVEASQEGRPLAWQSHPPIGLAAGEVWENHEHSRQSHGRLFPPGYPANASGNYGDRTGHGGWKPSPSRREDEAGARDGRDFRRPSGRSRSRTIFHHRFPTRQNSPGYRRLPAPAGPKRLGGIGFQPACGKQQRGAQINRSKGSPAGWRDIVRPTTAFSSHWRLASR